MNREEKRQLREQAAIEEHLQGGFLDRLLCAVGLHDWGRWSEPATYTVEWTDLITRETHTGGRLVQQRTCRACGEVQVKRL